MKDKLALVLPGLIVQMRKKTVQWKHFLLLFQSILNYKAAENLFQFEPYLIIDG